MASKFNVDYLKGSSSAQSDANDETLSKFKSTKAEANFIHYDYFKEMNKFERRLSDLNTRFENNSNLCIKKVGNEYCLAAFTFFCDKQRRKIMRISKLRYWDTKNQTIVSHLIPKETMKLFDFPIELFEYPETDDIYEATNEDWDIFITAFGNFYNITGILLNEANSKGLSAKTATEYLEAFQAMIGAPEKQIYLKLFAEEHSLFASCANKCSGKTIFPL